jgi:CheY-like chemotaxis protein
MAKTILIVDDDPLNVKLLEKIFARHNYSTISASDGRKALDLLLNSSTPPDLILSDIMMPGLDGYTFYNEVSKHKMFRFIPFIFLSGKNAPEDIRFAKKLGVDDYLTKPFQMDDLIATIEGKIKRHEENKQIVQTLQNKLNTVESHLIHASISEEEQNLIHLLIMGWDETLGPQIIQCEPPIENAAVPVESVAYQLFSTTAAVFGSDPIHNSETILLHIANMNMDGFILFDQIPHLNLFSMEESKNAVPTTPSNNCDGNLTTTTANADMILLVVIAPKITYLDSLELKKILIQLMEEMKKGTSPNLSESRKAIIQALLN